MILEITSWYSEDTKGFATIIIDGKEGEVTGRKDFVKALILSLESNADEIISS